MNHFGNDYAKEQLLKFFPRVDEEMIKNSIREDDIAKRKIKEYRNTVLKVSPWREKNKMIKNYTNRHKHQVSLDSHHNYEKNKKHCISIKSEFI